MRRLRRPVRAALAAAGVPTWNELAASEPEGGLHLRQAPGWLPRGRRVYAVGDVHGCREQLAALHAMIAADLLARPIASGVLIHLGDYIDRGPDSAGVVDMLLLGTPCGLPTINLLGDHERMLLQALDGDRASATDWLWSGGHASLQSWAIDPDRPRESWADALPAPHLAFLRGLPSLYREGGYLFVHAGIRPGIAIEAQPIDDLLTIRQPFLWTTEDFGVVVVHGHSTSPAPVVADNRIGIDTGAGNGGPLTCAVLETNRVGFLAA